MVNLLNEPNIRLLFQIVVIASSIEDYGLSIFTGFFICVRKNKKKSSLRAGANKNMNCKTYDNFESIKYGNIWSAFKVTNI